MNLEKLRSQQGLVRSSAIVFAGNSAARLLGFLFAVASARILGTQDFGRFAFGLTVASIAAILVTNAPRGLSRFLARAQDARQEQDNYFSNWLIVVALTLGVSGLLLGPISALAGIEGWMVVAVGANLLGVTVFEEDETGAHARPACAWAKNLTTSGQVHWSGVKINSDLNV